MLAGAPLVLTAAIAMFLALVVFYHGPGKTPNRALAALLLTTGVGSLANGMAAFTEGDADRYLASTWVRFGNDIGIISLLFAIPLALSWPVRRPGTPPILVALWPYAIAGMLLAFLRATLPDMAAHGVAPFSTLGAYVAVGNLLAAVKLALAYLLVREAAAEERSDLREARVLLALGLSLASVNAAARDLLLIPRYLGTGQGAALVDAICALVLMFPVAVLLIVAVVRMAGSRAARLGRILLIAAFLLGMLDIGLAYGMRALGLPVENVYWLRLFLYAFWRLVPIALLAYVVLRGQMPGLDVKVRWGISRSTVAAAFVAVFFVASEGAQIVFGNGNEWVGLVAAGALVFAIAPLQRAAERLADNAMPLAGPVPVGDASRDVAYRAAVRRYVRDGVLSREDERELAQLAGELGLHAGTAMEIRHQVESESSGGGP